MFNGIVKNDVITSILMRRSVREYLPKMISDSELSTLMACALMSPSAKNEQPCHVRFIKNKDMLDQMHTDFRNIVGFGTPVYTKSDVNPFYHNAPVFAAIFAPEDKKLDAGIMAENIAIAAKSMGLGTCIIGCIRDLFNDEILGAKWKIMLDVPEDCKYLIGVAVGYPNEIPELKERDESKISIIE